MNLYVSTTIIDLNEVHIHNINIITKLKYGKSKKKKNLYDDIAFDSLNNKQCLLLHARRDISGQIAPSNVHKIDLVIIVEECVPQCVLKKIVTIFMDALTIQQKNFKQQVNACKTTDLNVFQ